MKKRKSLFRRKQSNINRIIQKSKIFIRRLNFFDYLVFFLLFLVVLFFIYNRLQRQVVWIDVRLAVENVDWWYGSGSPPKYWYANQLQVGDELKDSFGNKIAEVINIDNYDQGGPFRMIYVDLKVSVSFDKNRNQYLYEFKPLTVGSSLILNFPENQLRGLVVQVGEENIDYFFKTMKVVKQGVLEGVPNGVLKAVADQINVGDKIYDSNGNLIAEILEIKKEIANWYEYSDIRGEMIKVFNPDYRDLEITIKVKAFNSLDRDYFINNAVLKVGSKIWFQFKDYAIEDATITETID